MVEKGERVRGCRPCLGPRDWTWGTETRNNTDRHINGPEARPADHSLPHSFDQGSSLRFLICEVGMIMPTL